MPPAVSQRYGHLVQQLLGWEVLAYWAQVGIQMPAWCMPAVESLPVKHAMNNTNSMTRYCEHQCQLDRARL